MSDPETTTKKYRVLKEFRGDKRHSKDDVVELTANQAKYLIFNGKIELSDKASTKPSEKSVK